jgi:SAM-dependent methyltransferase
MPTPAEVWSAHIKDEVRFWDEWMRTKGLEWPDSYSEVLTPDRPLQEDHRALLSVDGPIRILDVGAGPFTYLGTKWEGRDVTVVPVDPLADEYDRLRARYGLVAPVQTIRCAGEDLLAQFAENSFDLAVARNSLDHSFDPVIIIRNMVAIVKPGCVVRLHHLIREADRQKFEGLHQWNFYPQDGMFMIEGCGVPRVNVTELLATQAKVEVHGGEWAGWVLILLTKHL